MPMTCKCDCGGKRMVGLPNLFELFLNEMRVSVTKITVPIKSAADFPDMGLRAYLYGGAAPFLTVCRK